MEHGGGGAGHRWAPDPEGHHRAHLSPWTLSLSTPALEAQPPSWEEAGAQVEIANGLGRPPALGNGLQVAPPTLSSQRPWGRDKPPRLLPLPLPFPTTGALRGAKGSVLF